MKLKHRFAYDRVDDSNPYFMSYKTPNKMWSILVYLRYDKDDNLIIKGTVKKRKKGLYDTIGHIDTAKKHKDNGGDPLQQPMIVDYKVTPPYYVRFAAGEMYDLMYRKINR
jgi:hypothetical protein